MRLPIYNGPREFKELDAKKFNEFIGLIYRYWNDHNDGIRIWDNVNATNATITNLSFTTISSGPFSNWVSYTPAFTNSGGVNPTIGNGSITGAWRRVGDTMELVVRFYSGTTTTYGTANGQILVSLPATYTLTTAVVPADGNRTAKGEAAFWNATGAVVLPCVIVDYDAVSLFAFMSSNGFVLGNFFTAASASNSLEGHFSVPITGWSF